MWNNTAFEIYMGQRSCVTAAELEPALRREVLLETLADTQCAASTRSDERGHGRPGFGSILRALTAGRRIVRG